MTLSQRIGLRTIIAAPIFLVAACILSLFPSVRNLQLNVPGYSWALYVVYVLAIAAVADFSKAFLAALVQDTRFEPNKVVATILNGCAIYLIFALGFIATAATIPNEASCTSSFALLVGAVAFGTASGLCNLVYNRLTGKTN
jgi:hypothetical protein